MQSLTGKNTGDFLTADEWNQLPQEVQNVITNAGQTLTNADLNQLGRAIAAYVANGSFFNDTGAANAHVLTPIGTNQTGIAYANGDTVRFVPANANTSTTVTINVNGLGVANLVNADGTGPVIGQLNTQDIVEAYYDLANTRFVIIAGGGGAGGISWSTETANFTAANNRGYLFSGTNVTIVTAPASPNDGDTFSLADIDLSWTANQVTVDGNGTNIEGGTNLTLSVAGSLVTLVYSATTAQWETVPESGARNITEEIFPAGQSTYTLATAPPSEESIVVTIDNILQETSAYTLTTGNTVLDFGAPTTGQVAVRNLGFSLPIGTPADGTVSEDTLNNEMKGRVAEAWVNFDGTGTVSVRDSFNVGSITDRGTGLYTANFIVPMSANVYTPVCGGYANGTNTINHVDPFAPSTINSLPVKSQNAADVYVDAFLFTIVIFANV